jgi:cytidylate kinase
MSRKLIIAIDGPVSSGKSTIGRLLAKRLGYLYIDTGAMYRAVTWKALSAGVSLKDADGLTGLAERSRITLEGEPERLRVLIDGHEVTTEIRSPEISEATSVISTIPGVRQALVAEQQRLGRAGGVVLEGRDIGTAVFPNADVKFYLDAGVEVRARRRFEELAAKGSRVTFEEILRQTIERDQRDEEREASPLRQAEDAVYLDSSDLTVEQVVAMMLAVVRRNVEAQMNANETD